MKLLPQFAACLPAVGWYPGLPYIQGQLVAYDTGYGHKILYRQSGPNLNPVESEAPLQSTGWVFLDANNYPDV